MSNWHAFVEQQIKYILSLFVLNFSFGRIAQLVAHSPHKQVHVPNFGRFSGSEDRGGGDNSIQFSNFGRMGDKSFEEWRQKIGGLKGGSQQYFDFFVLLYQIRNATKHFPV